VLLLHVLQCKSYVRTYIQTVIRKFYSLKNILAYCGYSLTSPFFLLLSEHKYCDNRATNSNSENARSRMAVGLRVSVSAGKKENEPSTGRVWAAGFHHVTTRSRLARVFLTYEPIVSLRFQFFSGCGQPRIRRSTCTHASSEFISIMLRKND